MLFQRVPLIRLYIYRTRLWECRRWDLLRRLQLHLESKLRFPPSLTLWFTIKMVATITWPTMLLTETGSQIISPTVFLSALAKPLVRSPSTNLWNTTRYIDQRTFNKCIYRSISSNGLSTKSSSVSSPDIRTLMQRLFRCICISH